MSTPKSMNPTDLKRLQTTLKSEFSIVNGDQIYDKVTKRIRAKSKNSHGHLYTNIAVGNTRHSVQSARIIYFLEKGVWPEVLSFKDGNKQNVHIDNLDNTTFIAKMNIHKQPISKYNSTGFTGVFQTSNGAYKCMAKFFGRGLKYDNLTLEQAKEMYRCICEDRRVMFKRHIIA